jgi:hypothetical protein
MLSGAFEPLKAKKVDFVFVSTHSQDGHDIVLSTLREHSHRLTDQADVTVFGVRHIPRDAAMFDLVVFEHLVDGINRAAGHAGGVELPDPGLGRNPGWSCR